LTSDAAFLKPLARLYSASYKAEDGATYGLNFMADGWPEAEATASRLRLFDLGQLKATYPADDMSVTWALSKENPQ
jgi:hypothetical protein